MHGEARTTGANVDGDEFAVTVTDLQPADADVDAKTNHQHLVPGLFTDTRVGKGGSHHGAAKLCREYLDAVRPTYLFNWNPNSYTPNGAVAGTLGFGPGSRTGWRCQTKAVRVGDPVYLERLGTKHSKGIVAKARVCSEAYMGPHWDPWLLSVWAAS